MSQSPPAGDPLQENNRLNSVQRAAILGLGKSVPPHILTNETLGKRLKIPPEWILSRTGISERRIASESVATSDLCVEAARKTLEDAHLSSSELDLIIVCTVTPDHSFPATACLVQNRIGAKQASAFDLSIGCSGFVYGLAVGSQFVATGTYRNVMVIGADVISKIVDWEDSNTCILFGDAAGAAILHPSTREDRGVIDFHLAADGSGGDLLKIEAGGTRKPTTHETVQNKMHYLKMEGLPTFKQGIQTIASEVTTLLERNHLHARDIDCFIFHQANIRILQNAAKQLGLPLKKVFTNIRLYGNASAASVPLALEEARAEHKFAKGSYVILVGYGAGLSSASALLRW